MFASETTRDVHFVDEGGLRGENAFTESKLMFRIWLISISMFPNPFRPSVHAQLSKIHTVTPPGRYRFHSWAAVTLDGSLTWDVSFTPPRPCQKQHKRFSSLSSSPAPVASRITRSCVLSRSAAACKLPVLFALGPMLAALGSIFLLLSTPLRVRLISILVFISVDFSAALTTRH